ncbi:MAG: phosphoribosyltransferase [Spirochaetaceae bacterium]|jgi:hypoxanthine phosphoribosyltransferase|nr:phosphoribosyltransferase [Spirochaetaceae bacterium]
MAKEFLPYDTVRNNSIKLAHRILQDGFVPDVIYASLRGGAYMANVISEYFKIARPVDKGHPVLYAAVVSHSYTNIHAQGSVMVDGWTYNPEYLRTGDKILLIDDIFDTGFTVNYLTDILIKRGIPRRDIKVAVHDYKHFTNLPEQLPIQPDYWCRKFVIDQEEDSRWVHYLSHELVGLTSDELEEHYYSQDPDLREAMEAIFAVRDR